MFAVGAKRGRQKNACADGGSAISGAPSDQHLGSVNTVSIATARLPAVLSI
jgi:hypothetical protein